MKKEALRFESVRADDYAFGSLLDASFCLYEGETVFLTGLINSGKVTLVHILTGDIAKYEGCIRVQGQPAKLGSYENVRKSGIAFFGDSCHLFANLNLRDNIAISQTGKHLFSLLAQPHYDAGTRRLMEALQIDFSKKKLDELDPFTQAKLEILKAYAGGARILIFSTIYTYCTEPQAQQLAAIIETLNALGVTVILEDDEYFPIFEDLASRCLIVRGGMVSTLHKDENDIFDMDKLRHIVVGRAFSRRHNLAQHIAVNAQAPAFIHIDSDNIAAPIHLKKGAILGLYDVQARLPKTVGDLLAALGGEYRVSIDGKPFAPKSVKELVEQGVAIITKESANRPIFFNLSPVENVCIFTRKRFGQKVIYNQRIAEYMYDAVIRNYSAFEHCVELKNRKDCYGISFQQQNELMIAKWMAIDPRVLVFYTPIVGIDTKSAERFKELHAALSERGKTQILISASYDSLEDVCTDIMEV